MCFYGQRLTSDFIGKRNIRLKQQTGLLWKVKEKQKTQKFFFFFNLFIYLYVLISSHSMIPMIVSPCSSLSSPFTKL